MKDNLARDLRSNQFRSEDVKEFNSIVWDRIAPAWDINQLIASNPLKGFEDQEFFRAIDQATEVLAAKDIPEKLKTVNQHTIKWCQAFFDEGQAVLKLPGRNKGLFKSVKELIYYDKSLLNEQSDNYSYLKTLSDNPEVAINESLLRLGIKKDEADKFLYYMLISLNGWTSYVKYLSDWSEKEQKDLKLEYTALRIMLAALIWPEAKTLVSHYRSLPKHDNQKLFREIEINEAKYQTALNKQLASNIKANDVDFVPDAQFVFCIDVRSEYIRKTIESSGYYETFGFAGFFGVPLKIVNSPEKKSFCSCPALLKPQHKIFADWNSASKDLVDLLKFKKLTRIISKSYQSLKYSFVSPFALVESIGWISGAMLFLKTFKARSIIAFKNKALRNHDSLSEFEPDISKIHFQDQLKYAESLLRAIGLTKNFAENIFLVGHASKTTNNTFASALDCGACGGNHGLDNAKVMAKILNSPKVRHELRKTGIDLPAETVFFPGLHLTTTDELVLLTKNHSARSEIKNLTRKLARIKQQSQIYRNTSQKVLDCQDQLVDEIDQLSSDWSATRPEWGLARNASFIIGPRSLTAGISLEGQSFLHSYNWKSDKNQEILTQIMTAPMVVAQWINSQYFFSTLDNISFGAGSKVTQNVTGKSCVMQGNASDLMTGLPLQTVKINDQVDCHQLLRLHTYINAPRHYIERVIEDNSELQKLFFNNWVKLSCIDPEDSKIYYFRKGEWEAVNLN